MNGNDDRAMTIKDVAKFLNISTQMVYNLLKDGKLKAFKIGSASRIMFSDMQDFIERQKEEFAQQYAEGVLDDSLFTVSHLNVLKGDFALRDISFSFPKGKILSIVGPSGSGKTILLKAIAGLQHPESGAIFFGKKPFDTLPPRERKIGFVFEDYALFPHLTAKSNIAFPLKIGKQKKEVIDSETAERIDELGIEPFYLKRLPDILPEGIKQLVAIARGKNHDFDVFIMDEPMSQLDAAHHVQMRIFLQKMVRDMERTTIIAFNDPEDAMALSDYIAVVAEGRLLQFGEAWEVYHHPTNLLAMESVSRLGVNTIRVNVHDNQTQPYKLPVANEDGVYEMAFRPEEVQLASEGIPANIESAQFLTPKRKIARCTLSAGKEIQLLLPAEIEGQFFFLPMQPQFFQIDKA